ncbi:MAG: hypothetical protein AAFR40_01450 [Pseudomonadota bacterium]
MYVSGGALNPDALYSEEPGNCFLDSIQRFHELSFLSIAHGGCGSDYIFLIYGEDPSSSPGSTAMG